MWGSRGPKYYCSKSFIVRLLLAQYVKGRLLTRPKVHQMSAVCSTDSEALQHSASNWKFMALCLMGNGYLGTIPSLHIPKEILDRSHRSLHKVGGNRGRPNHNWGPDSALLLERSHLQIWHSSHPDHGQWEAFQQWQVQDFLLWVRHQTQVHISHPPLDKWVDESHQSYHNAGTEKKARQKEGKLGWRAQQRHLDL